MDFTQSPILPELIYKFKCEEDLLTETLNTLKKEKFSNAGLNQKTTNPSLNKDPKYEVIHKWFQDCLKAVHAYYKFDCEHITITQTWGVKYSKDNSQHPHNHPNSLISGVFYLTDSETPTVFVKESMWKDSKCIKVDTAKTDIRYQLFHNEPAEAGKLILFPSTLNHVVPVHGAKDNRYTMSFNTFPSGKCGDVNDLRGVNIQIL